MNFEIESNELHKWQHRSFQSEDAAGKTQCQFCVTEIFAGANFLVALRATATFNS
jgi:hypothetical protein